MSRVTVVGETGDNIIVGKAGVGTVVVTRRGWSGEKKKKKKSKDKRNKVLASAGALRQMVSSALGGPSPRKSRVWEEVTVVVGLY